MQFQLQAKGKSGATVDMAISADFVPADNAGSFAWKSIVGPANEDGYAHLARNPGTVLKKNPNSTINSIEFIQ